MKERPIIFSGHSVNAILAGRKTQTRRAVKVSACHRFNVTEINSRWWYHDECQDPLDGNELRCPYGVIDDYLWVRETWLKLRRHHRHDTTKPDDWLVSWVNKPRRNSCAYRADETAESERCRLELGYKKWSPPIHMPRWASRITLEVVNVRVERLQDITPKDAIAEGFMPTKENGLDTPEGFRAAAAKVGGPYPRGFFADSWDKLNANRGHSWASNPWVWVIEFNRVSDR